ncbi:glycosyltransferase family 2 protein [Falsirhodobacter deserti]|uniref:glycosyltransferase family 2 protein n=1 Tax=Falsirhodobacter deserti TaxID=1365611 RepID=UPI000FE2BB1B|nr:glycosyltransferase family 2 protein [Falsirhodobacter deserti]
MTETARIGSLWVGGTLSWTQIASIRSFLELGHDFTLFTYHGVPNAPEGAHVMDAREVWDVDLPRPAETEAATNHVDAFRTFMIAQEGMVWAGMDILALRPFPASMKWFLGHERSERQLLCDAIVGMPHGSRTLGAMMNFLTAEAPIPPWAKAGTRRRLQRMRDHGASVPLEDLSWDTTGSEALTWFATEAGEMEHALPASTFFPLSFDERKRLVKPPERESLIAQLEQDQSLCLRIFQPWLQKFTSNLPGGLPARTSWLGSHLESRGLADYEAIPTPAAGKIRYVPTPEEKAAERAAIALDPESFLSDLAARRKNIPGGANTSPNGRITLVTMAKDEGPYVLEWVAYHHLLGFTDILAYTNDCTDGTDEMLDALAGLGLVTRMENPPIRDMPPQSRALKRAAHHPLVRSSDYLMVMDFDEFLAIKTEAGDVDSLIDLMNQTDTDAMAVTWRFFGSSGIQRYVEAPVTRRLVWAADDDFNPGYGVKTLYRNEDYLRIAIHRPRAQSHIENPPGLPWINGSAQPIDGRVMTWRQTRHSKGYDFAQVNHYGVKTHEEYLMRRLRGDVLNNHGKYDLNYFRRFDRNEIEDRSALRMADRLDALLATLRADPAIAAAEALIRKRFDAKLKRLRMSEGYQEEMRDMANQSRIITVT